MNFWEFYASRFICIVFDFTSFHITTNDFWNPFVDFLLRVCQLPMFLSKYLDYSRAINWHVITSFVFLLLHSLTSTPSYLCALSNLSPLVAATLASQYSHSVCLLLNLIIWFYSFQLLVILYLIFSVTKNTYSMISKSKRTLWKYWSFLMFAFKWLLLFVSFSCLNLAVEILSIWHYKAINACVIEQYM